MSISVFGLDFWVVNMNNNLTFGLRIINIGLGDLHFQGPRNKHCICIKWDMFDTDLILNLMINHELANDYVMTDLFSSAMIYFRVFALFAIAFCLRLL
jgi:hypothetical protein